MATVTEMLPDDYVEPSTMIDRARALIPVIRENQEKTERDRRGVAAAPLLSHGGV